VKLIFSRKGFDSSAGGVPSPLVDDRPISLPIPTRMPTPTRYGDLANGVAELVSDLTRGRIAADRPCHLDPDIDASSLVRKPGWRGALGQVSAAQTHLSNNGVGQGDIFLFWGLYRPATRSQKGSWKFDGMAEHRLFGWLQIDEALTIGEDPSTVLTRYPWLRSHPHFATGWPANNTVYIAREKLVLRGLAVDVPGFGVLSRGLRLTAPASTLPSLWAVPSWLDPLRGGTGMTYHPTERWNYEGTLRSAARGQEFVADAGDRQDAVDWLLQVLAGETEV
jgi:hypothetical protein